MKHMPPEETEEETQEQPKELNRIQNLVGTIQQLQSETEHLKLQLEKARRIPSGKIGIIFLVPGVLSLIYSILQNSQILAFIGLGLTFWGALFFFIRPIRYVKSSLLPSSAASTYSTIHRITKDLQYKGKSYYIPPYPKDIYLPEHLKGLKELIVFISADSGTEMPSIEEMAESKFLLKNPKGICITPPGLGLLTQIEDQLRTDLTKLELDELCQTLPPLILENFPLAKDIQMNIQENQIHLTVTDSIYKNLYTPTETLETIRSLGTPLTSAIACALAKTTGKIVTIQEDHITPDLTTIEAWYQLSEG